MQPTLIGITAASSHAPPLCVSSLILYLEFEPKVGRNIKDVLEGLDISTLPALNQEKTLVVLSLRLWGLALPLLVVRLFLT